MSPYALQVASWSVSWSTIEAETRAIYEQLNRSGFYFFCKTFNLSPYVNNLVLTPLNLNPYKKGQISTICPFWLRYKYLFVSLSKEYHNQLKID